MSADRTSFLSNRPDTRFTVVIVSTRHWRITHFVSPADCTCFLLSHDFAPLFQPPYMFPIGVQIKRLYVV